MSTFNVDTLFTRSLNRPLKALQETLSKKPIDTVQKDISERLSRGAEVFVGNQLEVLASDSLKTLSQAIEKENHEQVLAVYFPNMTEWQLRKLNTVDLCLAQTQEFITQKLSIEGVVLKSSKPIQNVRFVKNETQDGGEVQVTQLFYALESHPKEGKSFLYYKDENNAIQQVEKNSPCGIAIYKGTQALQHKDSNRLKYINDPRTPLEISYHDETENVQNEQKTVILNGPLLSFKDKIDFTDDNPTLKWKTRYQIAPQVTLSKSWGDRIRDAIQAIIGALTRFFTRKKSTRTEPSVLPENKVQSSQTMSLPPIVEGDKPLLDNDRAPDSKTSVSVQDLPAGQSKKHTK